MDVDLNLDDEFSVRKIKGTQIDVSSWPMPDVGALDDSARAQFLSRRTAVRMYLRGEPEKHIKEVCGVGLKQAYRLITERCLEIHPDGQVFGWRGLVRYMRVQPYRRSKKLAVADDGRGTAGAMTLLLEKEPKLAKALQKRILPPKGGKKLTEHPSPKAHATWFVDQLRALGYEIRNEWPFNTHSNGYFSVYRYIKTVLAENPRAAATAIGGPDLARKMLSGDGVDRPTSRVLERVEMDAHKLDGRFCVMMPQLDGDWIPKIIHRLWVIVILDVVSRAVLGYHLSLRLEVSKDDVLAALKHALSKWTRRDIYFSDVPYKESAALPSGVREDWVGLCWDETSVDGALAQTCITVRTKLKEVVGSELLDPENSFAVRRSKDDRPFIETFFRTLSERGFQRMSNTTGNSPAARKGRDPEGVAVESQFQLEYAEELLDVLIANYNATRHHNLGSRTPLQYLNFVSSRADFTARRADPALVTQLVSFRKKCVVKGGPEEGRAPYVNFVHGKYSSEQLANRLDLVGQDVWIINHIDSDARVVMCSTVDGQPLGTLRAAPPWHKLPHSLSVRKSIAAAVRRGKFSFEEGADGVETFMKFVESQPNKKLPVHPAYLEARRILVTLAEEMVGESMVARSKASGNSEPASESRRQKRAKEIVEDKPATESGTPRKLPARRMIVS